MNISEFFKSSEEQLPVILEKYRFRVEVLQISGTVEKNIKIADEILSSTGKGFLFGEKLQDFKKWRLMRDLIYTLWYKPILSDETADIESILETSRYLFGADIMDRIDKERDGITNGFPVLENDTTRKLLNTSDGKRMVTLVAIENVLLNELNQAMFKLVQKYFRPSTSKGKRGGKRRVSRKKSSVSRKRSKKTQRRSKRRKM
jgi:hypothetical protein